MINLTINSIKITAEENKTILEVANQNNIEIPTLCADERLEPFGACGICAVEIEGSPRLFRACSTLISENMVIHTNTERVRRNRKTALELLLSDHCGDCKPPCSLACPAETDCRDYVKLIGGDEISSARKVIMEKIPLPASIGRVCPRPCEDACRRALVEEPIAIANLKQVAGDKLLGDDENLPLAEADTNKKVAIIGGGPGGLSAAYYLRLKGHEVCVFEAQSDFGGMLRYGIPEYRLPKAVLKQEIDLIEKTGVKLYNNRKIALNEVKNDYDAVIIAVGAWSSSALRCKGEDLDGVISGIDFLYKFAINQPLDLSRKNVAVVGGGNTAMDASRTALRLGAKNVYLVYRRTRAEMPAEKGEILEAEEEGVKFKFLTNPIEVMGDGKVNKLRLQIMELGKPDKSGRRAPVAVEGKEEILDVDIVIPAIGQKAKLDGFSEVELTNWGTISANEKTFEVNVIGETNISGVFAVGDAINKGADIAVSAIGSARRCAEAADRFLKGQTLLKETCDFLVKSEKTVQDFEDYEKKPRCKDLENNYKDEASRCLECGCAAFPDCKLIKYAKEYNVNPERFKGEAHRENVLTGDHPEILRNPEKCVLCGLCVRVCESVEGKSALAFSGRGFGTSIKPATFISFGEKQRLLDANCNSCGKCAEVCPTGALLKKKKG